MRPASRRDALAVQCAIRLGRLDRFSFIRDLRRWTSRYWGHKSGLIAFRDSDNGGVTYHIPFWDSQELILVRRASLLHPYMRRLIETYVKADSRVIDGGANLGAFTLAASQRLRDEGCLIAFEPDVRNRLALKQSVATSGLSGVVRIESSALADRPGRVSFWLSDAHGALSSLTRRSDADASIQVPSIALDDFLHESFGNCNVDFIKLDLEGGEAAAFRGMRQSLRAAKVVVLEVNRPQLEALDIDALQMVRDYCSAVKSDRVLIANELTGEVFAWSSTKFHDMLRKYDFLNVIYLCE